MDAFPPLISCDNLTPAIDTLNCFRKSRSQIGYSVIWHSLQVNGHYASVKAC